MNKKDKQTLVNSLFRKAVNHKDKNETKVNRIPYKVNLFTKVLKRKLFQ